MKFGKVLEQLLKEKGKKQSDLARSLRISPKTISEWTGSNGREPRSRHLKALSEYFDVSVHFLLFGEEDPRSASVNIFDRTETISGMFEISVKRINVKKERK